MLELFDFFSNPNTGVLKAKTSLLSFFHRNAFKLARALSLDFLTKLQLIINNKKPGTQNQQSAPLSSRRQTSPNVHRETIKIYDPARKPSNLQSQNPIIIDRRFDENNILGQIQSPLLNSNRTSGPRVINLETQNDNDDIFNLDITEVFNEILPKNRGWLMRKSNKKANKWSMVFFEIANDKLISYKPQSLKVKS